MQNDDDIPEVYLATDDKGHVVGRITQPTYEALVPCQIVMTDNGHTGPTRIEAGEVFTTDALPCEAWQPLNKAAAKRKEEWRRSLPTTGANVSQEDINQAAYELRPREGQDPIPQHLWWPTVLRNAEEIAKKRRGQLGSVAPGYRPTPTAAPPMPFAITSSNPAEAGMAPPGSQQPPANAPRRQQKNQRPAMSGANVTNSPSQAAG